MIISFRDEETEKFYQSENSRHFASVARVAIRKLIQLNEAGTLRDLAVPPGNRLEALKGDRAGQHSIRINDRWRICFHWTGSDAENVEICDYH
jgi:proteic killer suppression protein